MLSHANDDLRSVRLIWLPGIALGAVAALLVWPQTHRLVAQQLRLAIPTRDAVAAASPGRFTDSAVSNYALPIIRNCASEHPNDLSQQIAAASTLPPEAGERSAWPAALIRTFDSSIKTARLRALLPRFADQPALYATIVRLSTQGEVHVTRDEVNRFLPDRGGHPYTKNGAVVHSLPAAVEMFNSDCAAGERLDPGNGFFPTMHAISLFESHRDAEALDALDRAAACTRWEEYLDSELDGELALQTDAFGKPGPLPRVTYAAAILLPHLASIRAATELALYEAVEAEQAGNPAEGIRIRTSVRHIGSLMRCGSHNLIGVLVGLSLVRMSLMRPDGAPAHVGSPGHKIADVFEQKAEREALERDFDAYLASIGRSGDSESVHAEIDACVKARAIIRTGIGKSVFEGTDMINVLQLSITDMILLSTVLWMAALGGLVWLLAAAAGSKPIRKLQRSRRFALMLILTLAGSAATIAILVYQASGSVGAIAKLGEIWFNLSTPDGTSERHNALQILSDGYVGIIAVIPVLTLMILTSLCLTWRTPVAAGVARGLRGCTVPIISAIIIGYAVLAPITAVYESRLDSALTESIAHEGKAIARLVGAEWPGIVR